MEDLLREIRAEIATRFTNTSSYGRIYPAPLRAKTSAYVSQARERGERWSDIADALGINVCTIRAWHEAGAAPVAKPVQIQVKNDAEALTLHGPHGLWITGLTLDALAELLRKLS